MKIQGPWGGLRELCTSSQLGSASSTAAAAAERSVLLFPLYPYLFENSIKIKRKKKQECGRENETGVEEGGREGGGGWRMAEVLAVVAKAPNLHATAMRIV